MAILSVELLGGRVDCNTRRATSAANGVILDSISRWAARTSAAIRSLAALTMMAVFRSGFFKPRAALIENFLARGFLFVDKSPFGPASARPDTVLLSLQRLFAPLQPPFARQ